MDLSRITSLLHKLKNPTLADITCAVVLKIRNVINKTREFEFRNTHGYVHTGQEERCIQQAHF